MPETLESRARLGRKVFLGKFHGDRAALAEHMSEIRSRQTRLIALGKLMEEALEIVGNPPGKEDDRN